jgi:hypothetical protein
MEPGGARGSRPLDRLIEQPRIASEGVSATNSGAMNVVTMAYGPLHRERDALAISGAATWKSPPRSVHCQDLLSRTPKHLRLLQEARIIELPFLSEVSCREPPKRSETKNTSLKLSKSQVVAPRLMFGMQNAPALWLPCPLERNDFARLGWAIQIIGPMLHHPATLRKIIGMIVSCANLIALVVSQLPLDPIRFKSHFVEQC